MTIMIKCITLITLMLVISWCSKSSWDLYFYKDKDNLDDKNKWVIIHDLKSIDECRNKAKDLTYDYDNYDYAVSYTHLTLPTSDLV